tara:strand:+ start:443 stop:670 length:228 start_codon:yes stop_codon:yes gene_type:complete
MKVFDTLYTQDGFDLWWLHDSSKGGIKIYEDDLYYDEHNFLDACEEIVLSGEEYVNYAIDDRIIEGWEKELLINQ